MTLRPIFTALLMCMALPLAACNSDTSSVSMKAEQPIPPKTLKLMADQGMRKEDPILVRIYKEDSQLELWKKRSSDGRYALLKSYEVCRWSGNLGPKKQEGDHQAPEGFYSIAPGQMNPKSSYYLSFDMGFPNTYDRSLGRSGKHLMVHGDCLSAGCYAMTDGQIAELYSVAREAFRGGQKSFQVQAMPFRMTAENLARRRDNPNLAFWKNLKEGADHFEVTKLEPKVAVCGKKYVFDAQSSDGTPLDPTAPCPAYEVEPTVAQAIASKQRADDAKFATLVASGMQLAEAYIPQNGRVRRSLDEPVLSPSMIAAARANPVPAAQPAIALAMAETTSTPAPIPSPYRSAQPKPAAAQPGASAGMFAWLRPEDSKPVEPEPESTPVTTASISTPAASKGAAPKAQSGEPLLPRGTAPMTAALVPSPTLPVVEAPKKPLYKRLLSFGATDTGPVAPSLSEAVPASAPVPQPVQRTSSPQVTKAPSAPSAPPAAAANAPDLELRRTVSAEPSALPGAGILGTGFQRYQ